MKIEKIHHVSLNASDLERSRRFYREVLGLEEIERPNFSFPGAWFAVAGGQQLHLIVHDGAHLRNGGIDTRSQHFAIRVASFRSAIEHLRERGYQEGTGDDNPRKMRVQPHATAGFPQIYILDPDSNVIEINAAELD